MAKRASRRRIIRPPKVEKIKKVSQYARVDCELRIARNQFESLRRSLNMTQETFAQALGITKQCIQHYEIDRSFPTPNTWNKMKESAEQHGIILNDDILNEFMSKKREKKMAMLERHHQEKLDQINQSFNEKMRRYHHEVKLEEHQGDQA